MTVLAIQPGAIGDLVLSLPALRWLRQTLGGRGMEIWAQRATLPLLEHPAYADRARPLAETGLDSYPLPARTLAALESFDTVVSWRGASLPELVAAVQAVHPRAYFLQQFPPAEPPVHLTDFRSAQLLSLFGSEFDGASNFPSCPEIFFSESDLVFADNYLAEERAGGRPIVVLHPGASSRQKQWAAADFGALAVHLGRTCGARILLSEGPLDATAVEAVLVSAPGVYARRVSMSNLRHLAAVFRCCGLFIGNDTGITHLAAAAGLPTVAIFQTSDPRRWAPRGKLVRVFEKPSFAEAAEGLDEMFKQTLKGKHTHAR